MSVSVTGVVLSNILYEKAKSTCDKEGLLLGKISNITTDTISDTSITNVQHKTVYYLYSFLPCKRLFSWYNRNGSIKLDSLNDLLKDVDANEVIGWYKLRRNSSLAISVRERAIHRHLQDWCQGHQNRTSNFLFFLCVSQSTASSVPGGGGGLYTADHQFMISNNSQHFYNLPMTIMNLGSISKPDYRHTTNIISSSGSSAFDSLMKKSRSQFLTDHKELDSVKEIHSLSGRLYVKLQQLEKRVTESEEELAKEITEIKNLREKVAHSRAFLVQRQTSNDDDDLPSSELQFGTSKVPVVDPDVELIDLSEDYDMRRDDRVDDVLDDATQDPTEDTPVSTAAAAPASTTTAATNEEHLIPEKKQNEPFEFISDLIKLSMSPDQKRAMKITEKKNLKASNSNNQDENIEYVISDDDDANSRNHHQSPEYRDGQQHGSIQEAESNTVKNSARRRNRKK